MADNVFCTNCGTRCTDRDAFCPNCGTKIDSPAAPAAAPVRRAAEPKTAPLSGFSLTKLIVLAVSLIQIFLLLLTKWISFGFEGITVSGMSFFSAFQFSEIMDAGSIIVVILVILLILAALFMFGYAIAKLLFGDKVRFADKLPLVGADPVRWCLVASAVSALVAIFIGIATAILNAELELFSLSMFSMAGGPILGLILALITEALWVPPLRSILDKITLK